jgi:hypothetical protein
MQFRKIHRLKLSQIYWLNSLFTKWLFFLQLNLSFDSASCAILSIRFDPSILMLELGAIGFIWFAGEKKIKYKNFYSTVFDYKSVFEIGQKPKFLFIIKSHNNFLSWV